MLREDGMHTSMRVQGTEGLKKKQKTAHRPCWRINEGQVGEGYVRTAMVTGKNDASSYASLFIRGYIQWQVNGKVDCFVKAGYEADMKMEARSLFQCFTARVENAPLLRRGWLVLLTQVMMDKRRNLMGPLCKC